MTDTDRLVVWLRETMDAAWRNAEAAGGDEWAAQANGWHLSVLDSQQRTVAALPTRMPGGDDYGTASHIERHNPAAVLRRITADRKALARHQPRETLAVVKPPNKVGKATVCAHDGQAWPCPDITDLAEGYGWKDDQ